MNQQIAVLIRRSATTLATLAMAVGIGVVDNPAADQHAHQNQASSARLVLIVGENPYHPCLACVSGPDHGAMGQHYIRDAPVGDGKLDATPRSSYLRGVERSYAAGRRRVHR